MLARHYRSATILVLVLLAAFCAGDVRRGQPATTEVNSTDAAWYVLERAPGWHLTGKVTAQPAANGELLLTIAVAGPDDEITRRLMWHVAALGCDEWGPVAAYRKPKLYFPGTTIERSRVFHRAEDRFILDSDRRSLAIAAPADWTAEPFSISAFAYSGDGTGILTTCADLPAYH
jgi:hypothetical protein